MFVRALRLPAALLALLLTAPAFAAGVTAPPIKQLRGDYAAAMLARFVDTDADGRLVFECREALHGEPARRVALATLQPLPAPPQPGAVYALAYTTSRKHPQYREMRVVDTRGPLLYVGILCRIGRAFLILAPKDAQMHSP